VIFSVAAFTADRCCNPDRGNEYLAATDDNRNGFYGLWEVECQDAIDAYNQTIDDAKDLRKMSDEQFFDFMNPYVKAVRYNQAEIDAGFSGTGREFC